jgi:DNA-nicking Smr family endonuclease
MSLAEIRSLLREMLGILPTLDLHGLGVKEALRESEAFLRDARDRRISSVRIVYGKGRRSPGGRGVLREVVPKWLETEGRQFVRRYERRPDESGADGAIMIWVRLLDDDEYEVDEDEGQETGD